MAFPDRSNLCLDSILAWDACEPARYKPNSRRGMHATRGYTYWRFNDYRLNPANGNLPQRLIALPLLTGNYKFPSISNEGWRTSQGWQIARQWFYEIGNDADAMIRRGRAVSGLLAVSLGLLVLA